MPWDAGLARPWQVSRLPAWRLSFAWVSSEWGCGARTIRKWQDRSPGFQGVRGRIERAMAPWPRSGLGTHSPSANGEPLWPTSSGRLPPCTDRGRATCLVPSTGVLTQPAKCWGCAQADQTLTRSGPLLRSIDARRRVIFEPAQILFDAATGRPTLVFVLCPVQFGRDCLRGLSHPAIGRIETGADEGDDDELGHWRASRWRLEAKA